MIKSTRVRKLVASTSGLQKGLWVALLGVVLFVIGAGLSFKLLIVPLLSRLSLGTQWLVGFFLPAEQVETATHFLGGGLLFFGFYFAFVGARLTVNHIVDTLNPGLKSGKVDIYLRKRQLSKGPRIVAIGGGTGLSTLLRGLKQHSSNITAIVTVTDDGGSSGKLVAEKGIIPPGDIRNCLVALADAEKAMTDLFQHRFGRNSGSLSGHSMGNLLIAALVDQAHGDFEKAIEIASDVLAIRGRVVPSTLTSAKLRAVVEGGAEIVGETAIVESGHRIERIYLEPEGVEAYAAAIEAIESADLICIGPGSVYTSIIPNLLVPGIAQALREAKVPKAYICNVMTQPGESDSFSASEHVTAILNNVQKRVFDYVLVNTGAPSSLALDKYRESGQSFVEPDSDRIRAMGFRVLHGNYMSESDFVRHDPMKVAARLMGLLD
ncbi:MAG: gluconeogenesis factor YvcK family protein [Fimbriimonas sp.]